MQKYCLTIVYWIMIKNYKILAINSRKIRNIKSNNYNKANV